MNKVGAIILLAGLAGQAWGLEGKGNAADIFTVATGMGTLALSVSTSHPLETFGNAYGDALAYVASDGDIHGAQLEQALRAYRHAYPQSSVSDMQLAQAIASLP